MSEITKSIYIFLLVLARIGVIVYFAAIFNNKAFPKTMKIGLAVFMSFLISPSLISSADSTVYSNFFLNIAKESFTGFEIGITLGLFTEIFSSAGELLDNGAGYSMAQSYDMNTNTQSSALGKFLLITACLLLIQNGFLENTVNLIFNSFAVIPIGSLNLNKGILNNMLSSITYGAAIAIPVIGLIFISDVVMGILNKTIPQINMFSVGFIVKIFIGILLFYIYTLFLNSIVIKISDIILKMAGAV